MWEISTPALNNGQVCRQKTNREIRELTDVTTQMYLTDIYRTFQPNTIEYTLFSAPHGNISKIDLFLGKKNLNRYIKIGITACILSDHHNVKLEINKTNYKKSANSWKLNNANIKYH